MADFSSESSIPVEVFISYSHQDEKYKDELDKHLTILKKQGVIKTWHDRVISAGDEWKTQINKHLSIAEVIILLISPDFISSEYCYENEMKDALKRHEVGTACVIPIIIRPCMWKDTPFAKLQALPTDGCPVSKWPDRDDAFVNIVEGIKIAIQNKLKNRQKTKRPEKKQNLNVPKVPDNTSFARSDDNIAASTKVKDEDLHEKDSVTSDSGALTISSDKEKNVKKDLGIEEACSDKTSKHSIFNASDKSGSNSLKKNSDIVVAPVRGKDEKQHGKGFIASGNGNPLATKAKNMLFLSKIENKTTRGVLIACSILIFLCVSYFAVQQFRGIIPVSNLTESTIPPVTPTSTQEVISTPDVTSEQTPTVKSTPATPEQTPTAKPASISKSTSAAISSINHTPSINEISKPKYTSTPLVTTAPTSGTNIKVQFFNGYTAATTNTIYPDFRLVNTGTTAIILSNIKMRYYFTNDGTQANSFACDEASVGSGNITCTFATIAKINADRYLEIGFTSHAGSLAAGASAYVKGRLWKSDWSYFTQTNDYSFNASAINYIDSTTVTGYMAGTLKWGAEPQ